VYGEKGRKELLHVITGLAVKIVRPIQKKKKGEEKFGLSLNRGGEPYTQAGKRKKANSPPRAAVCVERKAGFWEKREEEKNRVATSRIPMGQPKARKQKKGATFLLVPPTASSPPRKSIKNFYHPDLEGGGGKKELLNMMSASPTTSTKNEEGGRKELCQNFPISLGWSPKGCPGKGGGKGGEGKKKKKTTEYPPAN